MMLCEALTNSLAASVIGYVAAASPDTITVVRLEVTTDRVGLEGRLSCIKLIVTIRTVSRKNSRLRRSNARAQACAY